MGLDGCRVTGARGVTQGLAIEPNMQSVGAKYRGS
jgi:hypothetical protein